MKALLAPPFVLGTEKICSPEFYRPPASIISVTMVATP